MRTCPLCSKPHEELSLCCKGCRRSALSSIRKEQRDKEAMLTEPEEE